ncbi:uncharacterized protein LOC9631882 isoform X2 [Selaginella moellendorffii]|uniref:uncharacterized protein LOC9631882 isoform X2 n=1 Tax=Selaginella moellendorffii TaxID=88036 RepID=UPI000D1C7F73|nr:uncharacterized protein LOC9631882 isoform X2 [Selaginella moellendorffii]|eukprot:XP_024521167.1 uncharacterized protein LOC9631882 isoform X2 [Selaginella moellendorffii]
MESDLWICCCELHFGLRGVRLEHSVASSEDEEWTMERLKSRAQPVRRLWLCWLRPLSKHKHDDHCFLETIANVVTSLPFIFVGLQAPRLAMNSIHCIESMPLCSQKEDCEQVLCRFLDRCWSCLELVPRIERKSSTTSKARRLHHDRNLSSVSIKSSSTIRELERIFRLLCSSRPVSTIPRDHSSHWTYRGHFRKARANTASSQASSQSPHHFLARRSHIVPRRWSLSTDSISPRRVASGRRRERSNLQQATRMKMKSCKTRILSF